MHDDNFYLYIVSIAVSPQQLQSCLWKTEIIHFPIVFSFKCILCQNDIFEMRAGSPNPNMILFPN